MIGNPFLPRSGMGWEGVGRVLCVSEDLWVQLVGPLETKIDPARHAAWETRVPPRSDWRGQKNRMDIIDPVCCTSETNTTL